MNIKKVIKERGYTLDRMAEEWNDKNGRPITKGTLSLTINGNPTVDSLRKIANVLGCSVSDFFADEIPATEKSMVFVCPKCGAKYHLTEVEH